MNESKKEVIDLTDDDGNDVGATTIPNNNINANNNDNNDEDDWIEVVRVKKPKQKIRKEQEQAAIIANTTNNDNNNMTTAISNPKQNDSPPYMIMLVGIPGSGKTTFAEKLIAANNNKANHKANKFVRISQDQLGTRKKCERKCYQTITNNQIPIIDRCNFDFNQRQYFNSILTAKARSSNSYGYRNGNRNGNGNGNEHNNSNNCNAAVDCIYFNYPLDVCMKRCENREYHETLHTTEQIRQVVTNMKSLMRPPTNKSNHNNNHHHRGEMYRNIIEIKSFEQVDEIISQYANL